MHVTLLYLLCGVLTGFLAGLLGIGGGSVLVPCLFYLLPLAGIAAVNIMHFAVGTSMAVIVFTSISSLWVHQKRGGILWGLLKFMAPAIILGTVIGALLASFLPGYALKRAFGIFMFYVSLRMLLNWGTSVAREFPKPSAIVVCSLGMGAICSLLGIGGGALVVPFLNRYAVPMRRVVATSAFCGLPIALAGSLSYVIMGWQATQSTPHALGYVYLPAFIGFTLGSISSAPVGARLAHRLPTHALRRIFAIFLLIVGLDMLI